MSRVAITTAPDRAEAAAAPYRAHGLEPVHLPCVRIEPAAEGVIADIREQAAGAAWLVATSPRTIAIVWPDGAMPSVPVAAVGSITARAVAEAGGTVGLVGSGGAFELAADLGEGEGTVVFPHAAGTDPGVFDTIATAGWSLIERTVYETVPVAPPDAAVDAVAFASPSAIRGWSLARPLKGLVTGVIGPTTAQALAEYGGVPDLIAEPPSHQGLATLMAVHLTERADR
ncbi:MAG TPA: uroporphyrinogen-III synthase [Acidimicrobiia bacterium]|nr:uroporphyrinogen-III synthase [Acidimicrobiia bacterium]